MDGIITAVGTVLTGYTTWFASISTMLLNNDLVKFIIALGVISAVIGFVMAIISYIKARRGKKRR